jgi:2-aminobenzoate-CoA ligase
MPDRPPRAPSAPTAHEDTFCRDHLPPRDAWPRMDYGALPELDYPDRLNFAATLLDGALARGWGEREALRSPDLSWSYRELRDRVNRIAAMLVEDLGLVPGERVLLRGPNGPMLAACWFAVLRAGGIVVCTMPLLRLREITYIADKARIRLALCEARFAADCAPAMAKTASGAARRGARLVLYGGERGEESELEALASRKATDFAACPTAADDPALIAFTSGTTGNAKGTVHFHRDLLAICDTFPPHVLRAEPGDLFCGSPPLAFTYGLGGLLLFPLRIGAAALLLEQAAPPQLAHAVAQHRATVCFTAPTAYRAMLALEPRPDLSSLRLCVSAGETLPLPTFEAWRRATGLRIIDGIGSTEMLHIFIASAGEDIRPGSTGRVVAGYEARIVDGEGREVADGDIGRLADRGPTGCRYLDDPDRQAAYVREGWNLTGDSFVRDADGYFWYQARTDDMIISSGYNISGPEVEAALLEHPRVLECGVVGVPDEHRGQIVKAYVVLRPEETTGPELAAELQTWVKQQIAPYKYPRAIEFVERLPRTLTGKLQRFRLREPEP